MFEKSTALLFTVKMLTLLGKKVSPDRPNVNCHS